MAFKKSQYNIFKKWVDAYLFEYANSPMALYEMIDWSTNEENYEAAKAVKDGLLEFFDKIVETNSLPTSRFLVAYQITIEDYKKDIEKLAVKLEYPFRERLDAKHKPLFVKKILN